MADTPWTGLADATALEAADIGVLQRGAGGLNYTFDMLAHKRADGFIHADFPMIVLGGNANQLALDNTGQQYTELDYKHNGSLKTATYWDNTNSTFVFRTLVSGAPIAFDVNASRRMTVGNTSLSFTGSLLSFGTGVGEVQITNDGSGAGHIATHYANEFYLRLWNANLVGKLTGSVWQPGGDGAISLGLSGARFSTLYATTGTINTSDARDKQLRGDGTPTEEERAWARGIRSVAYQLKESIAEKGEGAARIHFGVLAQQVHQAGLDAGIAEPFAYGFIGFDALFTTEEQSVEIERQKFNIVAEPVEEIKLRDGQPVLVKKLIERQEPIFEERGVIDEGGKPVLLERPKVERRVELAIELQDGKPVLVNREVDALVTRQLAVVDEAGEPVMVEVPDDAGGTKTVQARRAVPVIETVQATHPVPVMETVEIMQEVQVPLIDAETGEQAVRWNVRYAELEMFLRACAAADAEEG